MPFDSSGRWMSQDMAKGVQIQTGVPPQPPTATPQAAAQPVGTYRGTDTYPGSPAPMSSAPAAMPSPAPMQTAQLGQPVGMQQPTAPHQAFQQAYQQQQPQQQQSVTQSVQNNNPQSVQNFMSALHNVGAGSNNAQFNAPGQQGVASNVGFNGFQTNGGNPQLGANQFAAYQQQQPMNMNYNQNSAYVNQNSYARNWAQQGQYGQQYQPTATTYTNTQGGVGGVQGQPQWVTPGKWGQPGNAEPGQPGSAYSNDTSGWAQYLGGPNAAVTTPGQFYASAPPGKQESKDNVYYGPTAVSDERAKENISDASGELQDFLDHLGAYSYEYKDKEHGEGRYISSMAQEIESSKLGAPAIEVDPVSGLKRVNYARLIGTQTAALALLNQKQNDIEAKLKTLLKKSK